MRNAAWSFSFFLFFFFPQLPTLFPPGKGHFRFASMDVDFAITFRLLMRACLKTERLRWGSPTAIAPFAPLDFALQVKIIHLPACGKNY